MMLKLHKILLAVIALTVATVAGTNILPIHAEIPSTNIAWAASHHAAKAIAPLGFDSTSNTSSVGKQIQSVNRNLAFLGDKEDATAFALPPSVVSGLLVSRAPRLSAKIGSQSSVKRHADASGLCTTIALYEPRIPLANAHTLVATASADCISDTPLNKGPTS